MRVHTDAHKNAVWKRRPAGLLGRAVRARRVVYEASEALELGMDLGVVRARVLLVCLAPTPRQPCLVRVLRVVLHDRRFGSAAQRALDGPGALSSTAKSALEK